MATSQATVDELLEYLAEAGPVRARKMFGEYCVYLNEKPVALLCDDQLFVKPTEAGRAIAEATEAPPYPGAKPHLLIERERWPDKILIDLLRTTFAELPKPKPKRKKK